jgi:hypothetical protein
MEDDAEKTRLVDEDFNDDLSRQIARDDSGQSTLVGTTVAILTYPTIPQSFYGMKPTTILGAEVEGGNGILTTAGKIFRSLNLGSQIPPNGTVVINRFLDHRWVFRYDG